MTHHVQREIIFVEVPAAGSPEPHRHVKPGRHPRHHRDQPQPWRPARAIPTHPDKAAAQRLLDEVRRMQKPSATTIRCSSSSPG
jgi:hypothetical protein